MSENVIEVNEQCFLSEFQAADRDACVRWLNDPELYANTLRIPYPYSADDADRFLEVVENSTSKHGHPVFFAIRDTQQQLIGGFGFEGLIYGHQAEIGYWLAKPYRGQGLMTAVVARACQYAIQHWKLVRVTAHAFESNAASARVLEKCGFQLEGLLRKRHCKDGQFIDSRLYALIPD